MRIYDSGIYRDMTEAEVARLSSTDITELQIEALKRQLVETDYMAIKYAEGWITDTDYAPTKALRQSWRDEINRLEAEL